ncbi:Tetraacyldisaccharide 4'-kinase [Azospirillaceae bacterium]
MKAPTFWLRSPPTLKARALAPIGAVYSAVGWWRHKITQPWTAEIPVICVGNLVAGGAGKTPVAMALAELLLGRNETGQTPVHFITRGYGGRLKGPTQVDPDQHSAVDVGDEALLLAERAPTWVAHRRQDGAKAAECAGAKLIILDDGFQNPGLAKTASLIVADGGTGFGNGCVIPSGPLREPITRGLKRADAVIVVGEDRAGVVKTVAGRLPIFKARIAPEPALKERLEGERVLAFAGIGHPEKFFATCAATGARLIDCVSFPDHYPYLPEEIVTLANRARQAGAILVTTAKDAVRIRPDLRPMVLTLSVRLLWTAGALQGLLSLMEDKGCLSALSHNSNT